MRTICHHGQKGGTRKTTAATWNWQSRLSSLSHLIPPFSTSIRSTIVANWEDRREPTIRQSSNYPSESGGYVKP